MLAQINDKIAAWLTRYVGSMWCAYAFFALVIVPLFFPSINAAVQYISSAVIQLVLLPIIMVGSNVLSKASEERAAQDHETIMAEHAETRAILEEIRDMHGDLHKLLTGPQ